jgi:hypothetical protein
MGFNRNRCIHSKWDVNPQRSKAIPLPYVNMILQVCHFYATFPEPLNHLLDIRRGMQNESFFQKPSTFRGRETMAPVDLKF